MSAIPFTRSLGPRSGIQLNPLSDTTELFVGGNADQNFATVGRFERGRIDKAFRVSRGDLYRKLGKPSSPAVNRLNETFVHIYQAFQNGANEAVVYRLNETDAVLNSMFVVPDETAADVWSTAGSAPVGYILDIKHMECFNEGVYAEINAVESLDENDDPQATKSVVVRLRDATTKDILFEIAGSLDPEAKDEFGESIYLPNVASALTNDDVVITVPANASVPTTAAFYGKDEDGVDKFVGKALVYFTENGTTYDSEDYDRAMTALKYTEHRYGYLIGGGSRSVTLLSKLVALGVDINKQVLWDIPGEYTPSQAITFYNQLSIDTHYSQCYWAPLKAIDPLNGGKDYIGTSCDNVGMRCARNARTDANGVPPKNFPVAGKAFPLRRTSITQTHIPTEQELDDLARARINPVIFVNYLSGPRYVFADSLTGAKTEADRKLIAVADMSAQVDDWVAAYGQEVLQLPIEEAIKRMTEFLQLLFEGLEAAKWIKPSAQLDNRSFVATVRPNAQRPKDRLDVSYWLYYDGTTRAIYIQQTLSK